MTNYLPITKAEAGALCEALRILERSIVWYGTRDRSWERLTRFTADEVASFLRATVVMIRRKLRKVRRRKQPELLVLALARLLLLHWTGWYAGYAWVDDELMRAIGQQLESFLRLTDQPRPETDEPLKNILHAVWKARSRLGALAPRGRPYGALRFFGCEDWGRVGPRPEVRRSA